MNDTDMVGSVDNIEPEEPSDSEDAGIVDTEANVLRGADRATISKLSTSV